MRTLGAPCTRRTGTLLCLVVAIGACTAAPIDPRDQVLRLVERLVEAVEEGDPRVILEHVAFDFRSEDGLTYPDVQSIVLEYLVPARTIGARLESVEVDSVSTPSTEGEGELQVRARVRFARGTSLRSNLPPPPGSVLYVFELRFRRGDRGWEAARGSYRRLAR